MIRQALPQDRPGILALWGRVFKDTPLFINACLDEFAGFENVYLAMQDEVVVAQLLAVPCYIGCTKGIYLYALATDEKHRGGGIMTRLMAFAEGRYQKEGCAFSALIPASLPLFDYYRARGYTISVGLRHICMEMDINNHAAGGAQIDDVPNAETLQRLRTRFCAPPRIAFSRARELFVLHDLLAEGTLAVAGKQGFAVWQPHLGEPFVPELCAPDDAVALKLLKTVAQRGKAAHLCLTLPAHSPLFAGSGVLHPYALMKPLADVPLPVASFRFGLDDLFQIAFPSPS